MSEPRTPKREEFQALARQERIELIRQLIPLGLMAVAEELQREVAEILAQSADPQTGKPSAFRYGTNPGSVVLGSQRVPIRVPRVRKHAADVRLESYEMLHHERDQGLLFNSILRGVSCRDYQSTVKDYKGAISKSKSTISRQFVATSAKQLRDFQDRPFAGHDFVALFMDGKSFAADQMVVALGITMEGKKILLGFVQTGTENSRSVGLFLESLVTRGFNVEQGILAVIDGSKGLSGALKQAFPKRVVIQRCQWHKRENVVSYLAKSDQEQMRQWLQQAYDRPTFAEADEALKAIASNLQGANQSARASLAEGLKETLALHRLGVFAKIGKSFKTSNCIESVNALAEKVCGKIDNWKNSSQKARWLASALTDIEPKLHRVKGHEHLGELRVALKAELSL